MSVDVRKLASLAMLCIPGEEEERLMRDIPRVLALAEDLTGETDGPCSDTAVTMGTLREDIPGERDVERTFIKQSKYEKDGFVQVVRTVGGS